MIWYVSNLQIKYNSFDYKFRKNHIIDDKNFTEFLAQINLPDIPLKHFKE
ncbi:MAG: hypothetical protein J0G32_01660 [Alphaproteobacteria bacterium]|nr:hypothetical protein [Alphaproteobacteria bacterium]